MEAIFDSKLNKIKKEVVKALSEDLDKKYNESKIDLDKVKVEQKFLIEAVKLLSNEVRKNGNGK